MVIISEGRKGKRNKGRKRRNKIGTMREKTREDREERKIGNVVVVVSNRAVLNEFDHWRKRVVFWEEEEVTKTRDSRLLLSDFNSIYLYIYIYLCISSFFRKSESSSCIISHLELNWTLNTFCSG